MTVPLTPVDLVPGVDAWFTGAPSADALGAADVSDYEMAGNLSHRRPHLPSALARARAEVCAAAGIDLDQLHWMRQVHGFDVGVVTADTVPGAELRDVDALVTDRPGRALAVQVADCVPVLLAAPGGPVAAAHAGRNGVARGVVTATLEALRGLGADTGELMAAIGPAIGGCCYEVPASMRAEIGSAHPAAVATTTWGTPSLDLPRAVASTLEAAGVGTIRPSGVCTRCDPGWFSHRADPGAGRQIGIVMHHSEMVVQAPADAGRTPHTRGVAA